MKLYVRRSASTVHASRSCPELARGPVFELDRSDVPAAAKRCEQGRCRSAWSKETAR